MTLGEMSRKAKDQKVHRSGTEQSELVSLQVFLKAGADVTG